jgi:hypothetical protein
MDWIALFEKFLSEHGDRLSAILDADGCREGSFRHLRGRRGRARQRKEASDCLIRHGG